MQEVGNGGAAPGYGLLGIEYESEMTETLNEDDDFLVLPFLLNVAGNDLDLMIENEQEEEYAYFDNKFIQGTITIAHYGCGRFAKLVITGEQRGNIWMDDRGNVVVYILFLAVFAVFFMTVSQIMLMKMKICSSLYVLITGMMTD